MLIYPPAIALILLAMFGEHFHHDRKVYVWVTALTWAASLFDFFKTLPEQVQVLFHPVSYTHLDVYKRQYLTWGNNIDRRFLCFHYMNLSCGCLGTQ